jgi:hypothetical protein
MTGCISTTAQRSGINYEYCQSEQKISQHSTKKEEGEGWEAGEVHSAFVIHRHLPFMFMNKNKLYK